MSYNKEELFNLPAEEKYELVLDLWENIENEFLGKAMNRQGFEEEIERRIERIEKNPEILVSWEEVLKELKDQSSSFIYKNITGKLSEQLHSEKKPNLRKVQLKQRQSTNKGISRNPREWKRRI